MDEESEEESEREEQKKKIKNEFEKAVASTKRLLATKVELTFNRKNTTEVDGQIKAMDKWMTSKKKELLSGDDSYNEFIDKLIDDLNQFAEARGAELDGLYEERGKQTQQQQKQPTEDEKAAGNGMDVDNKSKRRITEVAGKKSGGKDDHNDDDEGGFDWDNL